MSSLLETRASSHEIAAGTAAPIADEGIRRPPRRKMLTVFVSFLAFMVMGNVVILVAHLWMASHDTQTDLHLGGIHNGRVVDDGLWRGGAPSTEGYRSLAAAGVDVVVDLRGERDLHVDADLLADLGLRRVHIPIRDGQPPSDAQVARFMDLMASEPGLVYVHCGAGVGRTGSMVAAYRVMSGATDGRTVLRDNLAVGPPSLEQLSYMVNATVDHPGRPHPVLVGASRMLDAPRRMLSYLK